jgi:hypothetical protein
MGSRAVAVSSFKTVSSWSLQSNRNNSGFLSSPARRVRLTTLGRDPRQVLAVLALVALDRALDHETEPTM